MHQNRNISLRVSSKMIFVLFTKIAWFDIRTPYREMIGFCSNTTIYKTHVILSFVPLSLSMLKRYIALLFWFDIKLNDFAYSKNAFYGREAQFEINNIENTLRFPLRYTNSMIVLFSEYYKIIKTHRNFLQILLLRKLEIASSQFECLHVGNRSFETCL